MNASNGSNGSTQSTALATREVGQKTVSRTDDTFRLGLEPTGFADMMAIAQAASVMRIGGVKSPEEALLRIMRGRSVGLTAVQALEYVFVINGRTGVDAMVLRGLAMQHPECVKFHFAESTPTTCTVVAQRRGAPEQRFTWTIEDAKRAKLADKDNWRAYPAQMLRARASTDAAKAVFSDAVAGMTSREEIVDTHGETISETTRALPSPPPPRDIAGELSAAVDAAESKDALKAIWARAIAAEKTGAIARPQKDALSRAMKTRAAALDAPVASAAPEAAEVETPSRAVDADGVVHDEQDDLGGRM